MVTPRPRRHSTDVADGQMARLGRTRLPARRAAGDGCGPAPPGSRFRRMIGAIRKRTPSRDWQTSTMVTTTREGANAPRINLYSDTQTLPTPAMRQAMATAEVGDEQLFDDPSVNALCERVAALLGHEAAVFLPSGTMCNEIAIRVHCQPGDEVIAEASSHILNFEGGGPRRPVGRADRRPARTARHLHGGTGALGHPRHPPVRAALRPPGSREHRQHGRRHSLAA